ncbi:hypothetical protein PybrP1_003822 [[Pythium] brassicae (nom. inval.)]|nr:hypothetical protein PybrP1_003822 [[Pythium] brassicae (nom. inval.)]
MEKDLRDAYKAMQLIRADLQRTRKEKEALEREAAALRSDNARLRAEQQSERTTEPQGSIDGDHDGGKAPPPRSDRSNQQPQQQQQGEAEEGDAEAPPAIVEEMVREKLGLLANLYSLKSKLDEQAAAMLAQQAAFAQERGELCMQLEELGDQFAQLQAHALEVEHEKQFIAEKYDFLVTELELLKRERSADSADSADADAAAPSPDSTADNTLQRECDALRHALEAATLEQNARAADSDAAVAVAEERHRAATERVQELENASERREASLRTLEATVERLTRELATAAVGLQAKTSAAEALERAAAALQAQISGLQTQLAEHRVTVAALASDKQQLAASVAETDERRQRELAQLQADHSRQLAENKAASLRTRHAADAVTALLERQVNAFETQHMAREDTAHAADDDDGGGDSAAFDTIATVSDSDAHVRAWAFVGSKARALGRFLAQLQSFAAVADAALHVCEPNARALAALSAQSPSRAAVAQDVVSLVRVVAQLQRRVAVSAHVKHARRVHRDVLELLTNWYESPGDGDDDSPAPPFGIASREAALVLHNWTADASKRRAAQRWLERMESVAASGAAAANDNSDDKGDPLATEGSTLELQHMTAEVKQAFAVLLVPILRRNRAIYVRVFTRRAGGGDTGRGAGSDRADDAAWEMKIHVQRRQRPSGTPRRRAAAAAPLELSGAVPVSPLRSEALATPTNRKLQLIQARLQHLQKR